MAVVTLESFFLHLLDKVEHVRNQVNRKKSMRDEVRTLEFWRGIIAECLASFFYVFILCGSHVVWQSEHTPGVLEKAITSGMTMATLSQCFGHISGAHINPAVTFAAFVTQKVTPLRALLYITAQCGGAIAGAALLYGVTIPGHLGALGICEVYSSLGPWQAFGVEFVLTFVVVFTVFATLDPNRKSLGSDSLAIGIAYLACSITGIPASGASMNPARSLGPAFVMNQWEHHWVYWFGPLTGGPLAGLIYEYIFDTKKTAKTLKEALDEIDRESNTDDDYEDPEAKINKYSNASQAQSASNYSRQHYDNYRPAVNTYSPTPSSNYPASSESVYGSHGVSSSNYASGVYGSRYATTMRTVPSRMEYGPGSTKF